MLQGAGLAAFMTVFETVVRGDPPGLAERVGILVVASAGGAVGGVVYYATDAWRIRGGVLKTTANVISLLAYCFAVVAVIWGLSEMGAFH
jgi:uncharacterized membrane protein YidH (DUF202 family)